MRYFLDTEFIEDGKTIDLVSIGICAWDGRSYYAISNECDHGRANDWVKENVLTHLEPMDLGRPWKSRSQIRDEILAFVGPEKPEFWGYYADYDWVVFCQLFGRMVDLPKNFPMYCRDLKQLLDDKGNPKIHFRPTIEHNALADAAWAMGVFDWLTNGESP
jgi:3' exoribonuclease, RNase T-like